VEAAILLNGKKFPPMLPRELRVTRCKAPHKTARAMEARLNRSAPDPSPRGKKRKRSESSYVPKPSAELQTLAGRASKLLGRFGAAKLAEQLPGVEVEGAPKKKKHQKDKDGKTGSPGKAKVVAKELQNGIKGPEQFVFEGRRASAKDGKPKDLKFKVKNKKKKKDPHSELKKKKKKAKAKAAKVGKK
jgi:nucleolar protein 12